MEPDIDIGDDYDSDDDNVFDLKTVHGDVVEPDFDIENYCDDSDDDYVFDLRKVHGNVIEPDINTDDDIFGIRKVHGHVAEP